MLHFTIVTSALVYLHPLLNKFFFKDISSCDLGLNIVIRLDIKDFLVVIS